MLKRIPNIETVITNCFYIFKETRKDSIDINNTKIIYLL